MKRFVAILIVFSAAVLATARTRGNMTVFLPQSGNTGHAVIVCPGGSYFWLDRKGEGQETAQWLADNGIAAFLLDYSVGGAFNYVFGTRLLYGGNRFPHMLQDVQKAIHEVRAHAGEYGVDPHKIGVMGFSAGGHLAMMSAEMSGTEYLEKIFPQVTQPLRPDFVVSIYPVVTMTDSRYVHKRSRRGLMGEYRMGDRALRQRLSLEHNVPDDCCPVFLLNCVDDPIVDYHNSVLLDSALTVHGIDHIYTQLQCGGHSFGCRDISAGDSRFNWRDLFLDWLRSLAL